MNKQEFLAASLPYDLQLMVLYQDSQECSNLKRIKTLTGYSTEKSPQAQMGYFAKLGYDTNVEFRGECSIKPIIRPISDLTKECVQADYNDGKPFIPIEHLHKNFPCYNFYMLTEDDKPVIGVDNADGDNDMIICDMVKIIEQLLKWHFWPDMPEGEEVVYVSESFNPYK